MLLLSMPSGGEWLWLSIGMVMLALSIIPFIFYLLTLQNTLKEIAPSNRKMKPGEVWLLLIPLFNVVWQFMVVDRMADSIAAECRARGISITERPGYSVGVAYCICFCCAWIPLLGSLAALAGIILWIVYWVRVYEYRRRITSAGQKFTH